MIFPRVCDTLVPCLSFLVVVLLVSFCSMNHLNSPQHQSPAIYQCFLASNKLEDKSSRRPHSLQYKSESESESESESVSRPGIWTETSSSCRGMKIKLIYGSANILANKSVQNKPSRWAIYSQHVHCRSRSRSQSSSFSSVYT